MQKISVYTRVMARETEGTEAVVVKAAGIAGDVRTARRTGPVRDLAEATRPAHAE